MVDLGGYVIILAETKDKKIKLYGSPADNDNLEVGDEILEINGRTLEDACHAEVISHIHQCIRSRTICLRVKRRSGARLAVDLDLCAGNVQDAFVIAVEQQAQERLERLTALKRVKPVDMTKLSLQLNQQAPSNEELNGFINNTPIYVTSLTATENFNNNPTGSGGGIKSEGGGGGVGGGGGGVLANTISVVATKELLNSSSNTPKLLSNGHEGGGIIGDYISHNQQQSGGGREDKTGIPNDVKIFATNTTTSGENLQSTLTTSATRETTPTHALAVYNSKLGNNTSNNSTSDSRRGSSPFQNGRTELLIGAEDNKLKTTALVENNNNNNNILGIDAENRPRRRSGSSIVVLDGELDAVKKPPDDLDEYNSMLTTMLSTTGTDDSGPHREMAVDVPDTFIARNKTPPRYPPPKSIIQKGINGTTPAPTPPMVSLPSPIANNVPSSTTNSSTTNSTISVPGLPSSVGGVVAVSKPVPPPRDHLKIEKDGRIVNKTPAPQLPARITNNNNNNVNSVAPSSITAISSVATTPGSTEPPTKEQLDSIKKYQEKIRQRKEEEDRIAAQNEFLNSSLRGSRKLQALENRLQGTINDAFTEDEAQELTTASTTATVTPAETEIVHTPYSYGDLVASVQRLQLQLKKAGTTPTTVVGGGTSCSLLGGLEGRVAAVQSLLLSPQFGRALAVHNKVQAVRARAMCRPLPPSPATIAANGNGGGQPSATADSAQTALRDCLDALANSQSAYAVELASLLTGYELEALMVAHDGVVATLPPADLDSPLLFSSGVVAAAATTATESCNVPSSQTRCGGGGDQRFAEDHIKIIKIEKSTEPLGATVRNEGEAVVIGRVVRGGAADKSGLLHEGDEILEVNGIEMRGKSVNAVCDILQAMEGTLTFLIVPAGSTHPGVGGRSHTGRDSVLHVRAHFDYDPEEDMYIPCRELGISFQKGDVLHVISQDDPNWWQAYREGEEDQTLAGLVPSQSFQHYRESMRLAAEERMSASTKPHHRKSASAASTLLCGGKSAIKSRKHKKKSFGIGGLGSGGGGGAGGTYAEGGYPIYTNSIEEHDPEEILTYEEVSLYYPRANNKRPIVLIGPPNIGRHELRQRLMEDSEKFAAAIPHTSRARKENEVDGQDYHFITRAQFEADILSRKFVEHGEYEKAYYGTSLDAIRSVVNSGKICVLNLHPQSLKILRTSDLKPYVVFVAPPSLEKLRQKKIRNGETYKEEELKDIIEKAREMEDKYGHFFDMIIINNDTERAYHQLLSEINSLEREPQWVPAAWVKAL